MSFYGFGRDVLVRKTVKFVYKKILYQDVVGKQTKYFVGLGVVFVMPERMKVQDHQERKICEKSF